jgi:hypothetical protein
VAGLTYYDTVGPCGVAESGRGSLDPDVFLSQPDAAYPLAIVLADACGLRDRPMVTVSGFDPAGLTALAAATSAGAVLLVGNLTRRSCPVQVQVRAGAHGRLRLLDEHTCGLAADDPAAFLRGGDSWAEERGLARFTLHPYGVARLDIHDD